MQRLSSIVITLSMMVVATSLGAVLHAVVGLAIGTAAGLSLALLILMFLMSERDARARERAAFDIRIGELERSSERMLAGLPPVDVAPAATEAAKVAVAPFGEDLATFGGQIAALAERVEALEGAAAKAVEGAEAAANATAVRVAEEDARFARLEAQAAAPRLPEPRIDAPRVDAPTSRVSAPVASPSFVSPPFAAPASHAYQPSVTQPIPVQAAAARDAAPSLSSFGPSLRDQVRRAVAAQRVEVHLQPVVSLPQRRTRWYEALTRLRLDDGRLLSPEDWIPAARAEGLLPVIDQTAVFRAIQVGRRLAARQSDLGLFCNLFGETLADNDVFPDFLAFLEANAELAQTVTFEVSQDAVKQFGPLELEALAAIVQRGFRFSLDATTDLRVDFPELAAHGFRFVKVPSEVLLHRMEAAGSEIHAADLSGLLVRYGLTLISTGIESEGTVVDLLDFDLRYGQGYLFSRPRPIRPELLAVAPRAAAEAAE